MSRRKEANRAEAIVRAVGALILLVVLLVGSQMLPQMLKGKSAEEMIGTLPKIITGFVILAGLVSVIGLIVWHRVLKGKPKGTQPFEPQTHFGTAEQKSSGPAEADVACPRCGQPMVVRNGSYGAFWGCSTYPNCRGTREVAAK